MPSGCQNLVRTLTILQTKLRISPRRGRGGSLTSSILIGSSSGVSVSPTRADLNLDPRGESDRNPPPKRYQEKKSLLLSISDCGSRLKVGPWTGCICRHLSHLRSVQKISNLVCLLLQTSSRSSSLLSREIECKVPAQKIYERRNLALEVSPFSWGVGVSKHFPVLSFLLISLLALESNKFLFQFPIPFCC